MISWKHSFKRLNEEYETARKKRQALDNLLDNGKISQSTHDMFAMEIAEAITDVERQQKALLQKMNAKVVELEEQVKSLEILLANSEIQHAVGEGDDETHKHEVDVLSVGLKASRQELAAMKEAMEQLASGDVFEETEAIKSEPVKEKSDEEVLKVEVSETKSAKSEPEPLEGAEESQPSEAAIEGERQPNA